MDTPLPFARLFDTPHGQLLVTTQAQDDDELWPLTIKCADVGDVIAELSFKFEAEADRNAALADYDQAQAEQIAAGMRRGLNKFMAAAS